MSMKSKSLTKVLGSLGIAAGLALGAAGIAAAATGTSTTPKAPTSAVGAPAAADKQDQQDPAGQQDQQDPQLNGSVRAADQAGAGESSDTGLQPLAKITPDQAKQAALAAVPGTVNKVDLGNENGSVVYDVEITANGTTTDVKVDAGNGKILGQDSGQDSGTDQAKSETGAEQTGAEPAESSVG
jgi:uncharacterized membrane protein YkoI